MNRRRAIGLALAASLCGCVSLDDLRERNYDEVTMRQLEAAAYSDDEAVLDGMTGLLERRLDAPETVDIDRALEALVSLAHAGRRSAAPVMARCALDDPHEDVRYVALETLHTVDRDAAKGVLERAAKDDASVLVRGHARELLEG